MERERRGQLHIHADPAAVYRAAAAEIVAGAREAVAARGRFMLALSGGQTPRGLYVLLADDPGLRAAVPWQQVHCFWGDERGVPPDDAASNYRQARETLLDPVRVPATHRHRFETEAGDPAVAARRYEADLRSAFGLATGELPRFDLVLLGLGGDGHIASLFPESVALGERQALAVATPGPAGQGWRLTLTLPVINRAATVLLLVTGEEKAEILAAVLDGPQQTARLPAQAVAPEAGRLLWFVDRAAASRLKR